MPGICKNIMLRTRYAVEHRYIPSMCQIFSADDKKRRNLVLLALSVAIFFVEQDRIPSRCLFLEVAGFSAFIWFPSQFRINHPKTLGFYFGCR